MPKLKSHSGAKKRLKLSATGKVVASHAGSNHYKRNQADPAKRRKSKIR